MVTEYRFLYVPKIMTIGWQYRQSYCKNKQAYFLAHPVSQWGDLFKKAEGCIISNQTGMKFGRIVLQVIGVHGLTYTHPLTKSDF